LHDATSGYCRFFNSNLGLVGHDFCTGSGTTGTPGATGDGIASGGDAL
jgi:hypothetical protein